MRPRSRFLLASSAKVRPATTDGPEWGRPARIPNRNTPPAMSRWRRFAISTQQSKTPSSTKVDAVDDKRVSECWVNRCGMDAADGHRCQSWIDLIAGA